MKKQYLFFVIVILICSRVNLFAQDNPEIISLYKGSELVFDDNIGFETHYYLTSETSHKAIDGKMRRQFCSVPEGTSPYEVVKNYEKAISSKGGEIIHFSRNAYRYADEKTGGWIWFMRDLFTNGRQERFNNWGYMQLPSEAEDYVAGKISTAANDIFISVASAAVDGTTYYTLVTVTAEPMDMNNVTLNVLNEGIADKGRVAIYDIYFDSGKSEVKSESSQALQVIADYLKNNDKKFLIVGHTDNTGDFDSNIKLSTDRAKAVIDKLVSEYKTNTEQLKPYGVGQTSPQMSNATNEGRARNRRVELVEL